MFLPILDESAAIQIPKGYGVWCPKEFENIWDFAQLAMPNPHLNQWRSRQLSNFAETVASLNYYSLKTTAHDLLRGDRCLVCGVDR
jgi:hypothetical protein